MTAFTGKFANPFIFSFSECFSGKKYRAPLSVGSFLAILSVGNSQLLISVFSVSGRLSKPGYLVLLLSIHQDCSL